MARKITFEVAPEAPQTTAAPAAAPSRAPALAGMAKSLQAAAAASVRDIPVELIELSPHQDRLEIDGAEIDALAASIRQHGQLVPLLVNPLAGGRFRIVYGRRRLLALRQLGQPAKALVRELSEDEAIIAQGQENALRKDLSWIEKAAFARLLIDDGRPDALICDALHIDQKARSTGDKLTNLSRMKQVTLRIAPQLIAAVGPAPAFGRDRWYALAQKLETAGFPAGNQHELIALIGGLAERGLSSDARFSALEKATLPRPAAAPAPPSQAGQVSVTARKATITISAQADRALHGWIRDNPAAALQALAAAHAATKIET